MPRKCSVCHHIDRYLIEQAMIKGERFTDISKKFRVSKDAIFRHQKQGHVSESVKSIVSTEEKQDNINLRACAQEVYDISIKAAKLATEKKQFNAVGSCLAPAARVLEILNKGGSEDTDPIRTQSGFSQAHDEMMKEHYAKCRPS